MPYFGARFEGDKAFVDALRKSAGRLGETVIQAVVGTTAVRIQEIMRRNLEAMIYSQPPAASGYVRTRTLFRSTHASPPDMDHSGDEARAHSGEDLATSAAQATGKASNGKIGSDIGSWISYADFVHDGVRQPEPRPFVDAAEDEANDIIEEEMTNFAARLKV